MPVYAGIWGAGHSEHCGTTPEGLCVPGMACATETSAGENHTLIRRTCLNAFATRGYKRLKAPLPHLAPDTEALAVSKVKPPRGHGSNGGPHQAVAPSALPHALSGALNYFRVPP